jgi:hypothetical protein
VQNVGANIKKVGANIKKVGANIKKSPRLCYECKTVQKLTIYGFASVSSLSTWAIAFKRAVLRNTQSIILTNFRAVIYL